MIRSRTVNTIHELAAQGQSIHAIATTLGLARNTVRKYLRMPSERLPQPRRKRGSKLDPFKAQIQEWVSRDHLYNCETMLPRLHTLGYTGKVSVLRAFVHPLRPPPAGQQPVQRYETAPGEQMQFDWAEFRYEREGVLHKLYGFTAILSYSRMRFVTFVKRCDTPTMIRCLMAAFEYFGGLPNGGRWLPMWPLLSLWRLWLLRSALRLRQVSASREAMEAHGGADGVHASAARETSAGERRHLMSYDLVAEANHHITINFGSVTMGNILAVLRANSALDETTPKPTEPSAWTPDNEGEWRAILAQRSPHPLQISVWKFRDNSGWIVHPDECYHLYPPLRAVPDPMVQRVARFCRRCVTHGGFAVL